MIEQHNSLSEKFLKKGFWLYLFSFIIAPIGYIIKIIISIELSVNEVGILYGVLSLITLISAYNDFGLTESLKFFIPKYITGNRYDKVKTILIYTILIQLITGLSIALFFFFGANYISIHYFNTIEAIGVLKSFSLYFLGINIFQIISTFFISIQNTFYNKIIDFIRMGSVLIFVLFIFFGNFGSITNFSYAWISGLYIGVIFALIFFFKNYYKKYLKNEKILWKKDLFYAIMRYSLIIFLGAQAGSILGQMDMQMIIYFLNTTDAGYYTNYQSIIGIPFVIIGPIFNILLPILAELHGKKELEKIRLVKSMFVRIFFIIGNALNILFFIFSREITYIFFGEKFLTSGVILKYSVLFLIFNFFLQINFNIMGGIGKIKERVKIILIAVIFNFFMNIILINYMGVSGAAVATGLGWIVIWVLSEIYLGKEYKTDYDYGLFIKNSLFMIFIGLITYFIALPLFNGLGRISSFFLLSIIGIIYFGIISIFNYSKLKLFILEIKKVRKK